MSDDENSTTNTAGTVNGIQAEHVNNSPVYNYSVDDPPWRKYEVGRNYLDNGAPLRARELIAEAVARDHDTAEVRFHLVLALLSKRSYRELTVDERAELGRLPVHLATYPDDEWTHALEVLCELLEHLDSCERDPASALEKLEALPQPQRHKIVRHCDLVLTDSMKDSLWAQVRRAAEHGRLDRDRRHRVWAYFYPTPARARSRYPAPNAATPEDQLRAGLASGLLATGLGFLGWILLQRTTLVAVISYVVALTCGAVAVRAGFEWRYRTRRLAAKERHYTHVNHRESPKPGFAKRIDHDFDHYAYTYTPKGADGSAWLADTRGIRSTLRNEVVELYREQRVESDQIRWLIRYLISDLATQWSQGTLFSYRHQYRTPLSGRTRCIAALAIASLATVAVAAAAVAADPLPALASVLTTVVGARVAATPWWRIHSERRRIIEETEEWERNLQARTDAYHRWKSKLEATCPDEDEMEAWLECDRAELIGQALDHYNLAWRDIIAHTIVQTPAPCRRRARVYGGPWRYQQYRLQLFLITTDGVRELNRHLNFETGDFHGRERGHFRFDAVSSLNVVETEEYNYTLELTLTNGPARTIDLTEPQQDLENPSDDEPGLSQVSLDSTGFNHALYILEGIAAEGKAWIHRTNIQGATHPSFSRSQSIV